SVSVEDRCPRSAIVSRLPDAVGREPDVDDVGILFDGSDVVDASTHAGWSNTTKHEALQQWIGGPVDGSRSRAGARRYTRALLWRCGRRSLRRSLILRMNRGSDKHQGTNDHNQQAKIVNGARPVFHAKVSFQLNCFLKLRGKYGQTCLRNINNVMR